MKENKFLEKLEEESNYKFTENAALTHASSKSALLDLFGLGGALRSRSEQEIISLFSRAFAEDPLLAMKCLFYLRDVRGGQGERRTFRIILNYLGVTQPEIALKNLENVPFFGRWDDLYSLVETHVGTDVLLLMRKQFNIDMTSKLPSLLGKWLKSPNTSSETSRMFAKITRNFFDLTEKQYRKSLSLLRKKINIVERKMCLNQWNEIDYEKIPSNASMIYRKAFKRHDLEGYEAYLNSVEKGEKTIKTKTLYPYDIMRAVDNEGYNKTLELQWKNLPNYVQEGEHSIVVCDTSGSMTGWGRHELAPIYVAVSLSIYFAERNKGPFENRFITFSMRPDLQKIVGSNLYEKFINLKNANWMGNTDLIAVFRLILNTATKYNIPQEEMIKKIYIISDMEFDVACNNNNKTNFDVIKEMYADTEYHVPDLVFWNVDARQDQSPITVDDRGVFLVSGCSPSIFENLMKSNALGPVDLVLEVLNQERYNRVKI